MKNELNIDGRTSPIVNPNLDEQIFLTATYRGRTYELTKISGAMYKKDKSDGGIILPALMMPLIGGLVLHFTPEDKKYEKDGLNTILLMTNKKGVYKATAASELPSSGKEAKWKTLGFNLEIKVSETADAAIKNI